MTQLDKKAYTKQVNTIKDIHSHILPNLDDGSRSMEETLEALRCAQSQNVSHMIMTPHYYPGRYETTPEKILSILEEVKKECSRQDISIQLYPGQECLYYTELVQKLQSGQVLTLAGSRYVLVEFEPQCAYNYMLYGLQELRRAGYIPILAHFERYECLFIGDHLEQLKKMGYLIQMNYDTLLKKNTLFHRFPWKAMVQRGEIDFLGSDCHGMHYRPIRAKDVWNWVDTHVETGVQKQLSDNYEKGIFKEL